MLGFLLQNYVETKTVSNSWKPKLYQILGNQNCIKFLETKTVSNSWKPKLYQILGNQNWIQILIQILIQYWKIMFLKSFRFLRSINPILNTNMG